MSDTKDQNRSQQMLRSEIRKHDDSMSRGDSRSGGQLDASTKATGITVTGPSRTYEGNVASNESDNSNREGSSGGKDRSDDMIG